jgi:hypothetical protein
MCGQLPKFFFGTELCSLVIYVVSNFVNSAAGSASDAVRLFVDGTFSKGVEGAEPDLFKMSTSCG